MYPRRKIYSIIISTVFAFPLLCLFLSSLTLSEQEYKTWDFLWKNQIPTLLNNSIKLLIGSISLSFIFSFSISFLLEFTNLKFKFLWEKLLLLPLIFPLYVLAYVYLVSFEWASPIMQSLRGLGFETLGSLNIKNSFGMSFIFSLGLFPYMIIPLRKQLKELKGELFWVAVSLKKSKVKAFTSLIIPLMKKPFLIGASLISMEVLADFGAVSIFNYDTFTTAIYTSWSGFFSYAVGARLSLFLIISSFLIFSFDEKIKKDQLTGYQCERFYESPFKLKISFQILGQTWLLIIFSMAFFFPLYQLIFWSSEAEQISSFSESLVLIKNSAILGTLVSLLACLLATVLVFHSRHKLKHSFFTKFSLIGYGVPGTVIGVAIYIGFVKVLNLNTSSFILIFALIFGLCYRFLILPYKYIQFESEKISKQIEASSLILKKSAFAYFRKVWLPLTAPSFKFALILTSIEAIKEMPLTLILRPVGFDTLATKIYEFTSEGDWERAAIPSLILVCFSLLMAIFLKQGNINDKN